MAEKSKQVLCIAFNTEQEMVDFAYDKNVAITQYYSFQNCDPSSYWKGIDAENVYVGRDRYDSAVTRRLATPTKLKGAFPE